MLDLSASDAIYIGDSPTDIEAAKAARMKSVFLSPNEHKHATTRVSEFNMLQDAVEELANQ